MAGYAGSYVITFSSRILERDFDSSLTLAISTGFYLRINIGSVWRSAAERMTELHQVFGQLKSVEEVTEQTPQPPLEPPLFRISNNHGQTARSRYKRPYREQERRGARKR